MSREKLHFWQSLGYYFGMKGFFVILSAGLLAGCGAAPVPSGQSGPQTQGVPPQIAARNFVAVLDAVEPVAESICTRAGTAANCDFQIVVDRRHGLPPNAFQTIDAQGRPIIAFTLSLIADAKNPDELAFIMGHEAGHHIAGHLARQQASALEGAVLAGVLATISGASQRTIDRAAQMGAGLAARRYSKDFELEADLLGTRIAHAAGYDPVLGAAFFDRLPDPGDEFLGTHPANADRKATVAREATRLRGS